MSLISKSCEYGLRATLYIAARRGDDYVSIRDISRDLDISFHFLTKILQKLTQHGILKSYRGPSGGVALARPVKSVSLLDVVQAIEDRELFTSCVLGLNECGEKTPCPLHAQWAQERARIQRMFRGTTLDKLAKPIAEGTLRLAN
ncbi:MAG TPA: Rrf2 family transcriptional regulator [Kiritimatiellia bacterium]|nr:Rrf2 family transcriptional regulator [Kiritimatiellia bacterium]HMP35059.1 Rrf2 family transcriptional regulator [Kiritimatiellia bacterium]